MKSILGIVLLSLSLAVQAAPRERPAAWSTAMIDTGMTNLYQVDKGVYRAAQPDDDDIGDLKAIGIKEVLNLREYHHDNGELDGARLILKRVPMNAGEVTQAQLIEALRIIKQRKGPILIHCWHGSDRTGVTVAAYRILFNHWSKQQALDEMIHGGYGYHAGIFPNLVELVKKLDIPAMRKALQLPEN